MKVTLRYMIIFHTVTAKPAEFYYAENSEDMKKLFLRIAELTKNKVKFAIYEFDKLVADLS